MNPFSTKDRNGPPTTVVVTNPCAASQLTDGLTGVVWEEESQTDPDTFASARLRQQQLESSASAERRKDKWLKRCLWGIIVVGLIVVSNVVVYYATINNSKCPVGLCDGGRDTPHSSSTLCPRGMVEGISILGISSIDSNCGPTSDLRAFSICTFVNRIKQNDDAIRYHPFSNETLSPDEQALAWIIKDENNHRAFNGEYPEDRLRQRFALASLYFHNRVMDEESTKFCGQLRNNWMIQEGSHECEWLGDWVECSEDQIVKAIRLDGYAGVKTSWAVDDAFSYLRCYVGSIPENLALLTDLTEINMSGQELQDSTIPSSLYSLSSLEQLNMAASTLKGTISSGLTKLTKLRVLELPRNNINGPIPPFLGDMTTLEVLRLDHNQISLSIPPSIMMLPHLHTLNLHENNLTGVIPPSIGSTNLVDLQLQGNSLTGTFPAAMSGLPVLARFFAFNNQFSGTVDHICSSGNNFEEIVVDCDIPCPCCEVCCNEDTVGYICKKEAGICLLADLWSYNHDSPFEENGSFGAAGPFMERVMECSCQCKE